jgi:phosphatidylglycerol:prolipoprotein diacylglycerol transferase
VTGADLPLPIPMFGLLVLVAVVISALVLRVELRRRWTAGELRADVATTSVHDVDDLGELDNFITNFAAVMLLSGVAGAKLFSLAEDPAALFAHPMRQVFSSNGFNIIGGLVVATAVGVLMVRRNGLRVPQVLDAAAPALMLGYAIGRIGCQVSGDGDWGIPANLSAKPGWLPDWLWAQQYEGNIIGVAIPAPGVHPTPLWEVAMALVVFAVLWALRRHPYRAGWLFCAYLVLASAERLVIEPFRVNEVYGPLQASQAQYLSALFLVVGLVGLVRLTRIARSGTQPRAQGHAAG